jgi:electron transfer flavoprotein beta subunit
VAERLGLPFVTGVTSLTVEEGTVVAGREVTGGEELYELELPAVVAVKEGLNEPRYASMRGKMRARKQEIPRLDPAAPDLVGRYEKRRLEAPETDDGDAERLGEGTDAVPATAELLDEELEVI